MIYIVKVKGSDTVVAICSRKQDAMAYLGTNLDSVCYYIEEHRIEEVRSKDNVGSG